MKRALLLLCVVLVACLALGFVLEHSLLAHEHEATRWCWPANEDSDLPAPTESRGLTWIASRPWLPTSREHASEVDWLRRKLAERGIVSTAPEFVQVEAEGLAATVDGLEFRRGSLVVVALDARDCARGGRLATERSREPNALDRFLGVVPAVRLLATGSPARPRLLTGVASGAYPVDLWPWRRGGAPRESERFAGLRRGLEQLKTRARTLDLKIVFLRLPTAFEVDDGLASTLLEDLGLDSLLFETRRLDRRVTDLCTELEVPHVSMRDALRRLHERQPVFTGSGLDVHPTEPARRAAIGPALQRLRAQID